MASPTSGRTARHFAPDPEPQIARIPNQSPWTLKNLSLGAISWEQQKSYRAEVQFRVRLKTMQGEEFVVAAVNLSSRGMGIAGLTRSAQGRRHRGRIV